MVIREQYEYSAPIFPAANTLLVSESRLKLVDQSQSAYAAKDEGVSFDAYLEILKKGKPEAPCRLNSSEGRLLLENNLQHLSDSVEELFANAAAPEPQPSLASNGKCGQLGGIEKLKSLQPSTNVGPALKALLSLENHLRSVDQAHLTECLEHVREVRPAMLSALVASLAVAGRRQAQKTVLQFLSKHSEEDELRKAYFVMLAHNLWPAKVAPEALVRLECHEGIF